MVGHCYVGWTSGRAAGAGGNGRAKNVIVKMICIYSYVINPTSTRAPMWVLVVSDCPVKMPNRSLVCAETERD